MSAMTDPVLCTAPQDTAPHETEEARAEYAAEVRATGIRTALDHLAKEHPAPGSALRAMAYTVEAELALEGYAGIRVYVAESMARLRAAHRGAVMDIPRSYELVLA